MNGANPAVRALLVVGVLIVVGIIAVKALGWLFSIIGYLLVGALVVGVCWWLFTKLARNGRIRR